MDQNSGVGIDCDYFITCIHLPVTTWSDFNIIKVRSTIYIRIFFQSFSFIHTVISMDSIQFRRLTMDLVDFFKSISNHGAMQSFISLVFGMDVLE